MLDSIPLSLNTLSASMENKLDDVVSGDESRVNLLSDFYKKFIKLLDNAYENMEKIKYEETGEVCPKCGTRYRFHGTTTGRWNLDSFIGDLYTQLSIQK